MNIIVNIILGLLGITLTLCVFMVLYLFFFKAIPEFYKQFIRKKL
jgi:uncharacterized membrane protein YbaN (DUF454 family)